jgi:hypothetical protein
VEWECAARLARVHYAQPLCGPRHAPDAAYAAATAAVGTWAVTAATVQGGPTAAAAAAGLMHPAGCRDRDRGVGSRHCCWQA